MELPPIIVISLERSHDRRAYIINHLAERSVTDYKIFPAFDGEQLGVTSKLPYLRDWSDWAPPYGTGDRPPYFVGHGIHGLMLTYIAMSKMAVMLQTPELIILEDDVELCEDFPARYAEFRRELPNDYRYAHLGSSPRYCTSLNQISPMVAHGYACCTEAMLYSADALRLISERGMLYAPYDAFLMDHIAINQRAHVAYPFKLARQLSADGDMPTTLS